MHYGNSLAADERTDGPFRVYGSNGPVGYHDVANTRAPAIIVGRKGSHGKLHFSSEPVFAIDTTFFIDSTATSCNLRWLFYALSTLGLDKITTDVGVPGLSRDQAYQLHMPLPPPLEQEAIADYLDTETTRINALITKKRQIAELIEARSMQRQVELVCGRSPGMRTRESGHDWMGQVPSHWTIERLKYVARLESGHTPSRSRPELWENCDTPWVTLNDVGYLETHEFIDQTVNLISQAGLSASSARVLPQGTVVLSRDATVGRCGVLGVPMATSQHFVDWVCSERLRPRFLWLLFRTAMQTHFESLTAGATLMTIGMPDVKRLVVPVPPVVEQEEIVLQAETVRSRTNRGVSALQRQIALLQERRHALITAAVTGEHPLVVALAAKNDEGGRRSAPVLQAKLPDQGTATSAGA